MAKRKRSPISLSIGFISCMKGREWSRANCQNIMSSFLSMAISATATRFRALLLLAGLYAGGATVRAQNAPHPAESPLMRQVHQALSLAEHGNNQEAMNLVLRLLEQKPDFVPALKLKGMLLEEAGRTSESAAVYEQALKLAPNDGDLLLKAGIYKLTAGQKEEAIKLLHHCIRVLPCDGDAQFYLAQAYHLNGQDDLALRAIRQSANAAPDDPSVLQQHGELLCSTKDVQPQLERLVRPHRPHPTFPP